MSNTMYIRGLHSAKGQGYLQYSQLNSASFKITNCIDSLFSTIVCSHTMWMNTSPPKTTCMAPTGGLFALQQPPDNNVGEANDTAGNTPKRDTQFGQPSYQFHSPPPGSCYPPSQPPFPGAPQFYHQAQFNITPSSQPGSGAIQG